MEQLELKDVIKARREKLKLTKQDAADKAGVSRPYWSELESGHYGMTIRNGKKVAAALNTKLSTLLKACGE